MNQMNQTSYNAQGAANSNFGHLRNKSNGAKLSQYQGVHGTINGPNNGGMGM
jgi:hypothetical protein